MMNIIQPLKPILALLLISTFMLIACSSNNGLTYVSGEPFDINKTNTIEIGMSVQQVLEIMEMSPHHVEQLQDVQTWIWVHTDENQNSDEEVFAVTFEKNMVKHATLQIGGYYKSLHTEEKVDFNVR